MAAPAARPAITPSPPLTAAVGNAAPPVDTLLVDGPADPLEDKPLDEGATVESEPVLDVAVPVSVVTGGEVIVASCDIDVDVDADAEAAPEPELDEEPSVVVASLAEEEAVEVAAPKPDR